MEKRKLIEEMINIKEQLNKEAKDMQGTGNKFVSAMVNELTDSFYSNIDKLIVDVLEIPNEELFVRKVVARLLDFDMLEEGKNAVIDLIIDWESISEKSDKVGIIYKEKSNQKFYYTDLVRYQENQNNGVEVIQKPKERSEMSGSKTRKGTVSAS